MNKSKLSSATLSLFFSLISLTDLVKLILTFSMSLLILFIKGSYEAIDSKLSKGKCTQVKFWE